MGFQDAKLWLLGFIGLSKDALHVYVGMIVFLGVALLFRLPLRDWRPLAAVFLAAVAGEVFDLFESLAPNEDPRWAATWHDLWNTMLWPTVLFVLARWSGVLKR